MLQVSRFLRALVLGCVPAAVAGASNQVIVLAPTAGPGVDATTLAGALALAGADDTVLVKSGSYASATQVLVDKPLSIAADAGATVTFTQRIAIESIGFGQQLALRGIKVLEIDDGAALTITNCAGSVWIEDCWLQSDAFLFGAHDDAVKASSCAALTFSRCTLKGAKGSNGAGTGFHAFSSTATTASFYDSTPTGGTGVGFGIAGGDGAHVIGGFLFAAGTTFNGGSGQAGNEIGCGMGDGGDGAHLVSGAPVISTIGVTFVPGPAGAPGPFPLCPPKSAGSGLRIDSGSHTALAGGAHKFHVSPVAREGQSIAKTYEGLPGEFVFRNYSGFQGSAYFVDFRGVLALSLFAPINTKLEGVLPASGQLVDTSSIGPLSAGTEGVTLYLQAAFYNTTTGIFLGTPSCALLLDAAF